MKKENVKKGEKIVTVTIGIVSFILTFIIFMQFKFVQNTDISSIKSMREDELKEELALWKSKNREIDFQLEETYKKIAEYNDNIENYEETKKLIEEELQQNRVLLGQTDVYGEGVIIYYEDDRKKVTDKDLLKLVKELYIAGAEAVSINDNRIVNSTNISVGEDDKIYMTGTQVNSPFVIKAIGNSELISRTLTGKNALGDKAPEEGKKFSIEVQKNVKIPKCSKEQKADNINLK